MAAHRLLPPSQKRRWLIGVPFTRAAAALTASALAFALGCRSNDADASGSRHEHTAPAQTPEAAQTSSRANGALVRVADRKKVCMVNNQYMGRDQIRIVVEGKEYFGCCPMCEGKLRDDARARTANDPLTGKPVDKALAVIAKTGSGSVLYFENEQNLARFAAR